MHFPVKIKILTERQDYKVVVKTSNTLLEHKVHIAMQEAKET